MIQDEYKTGFSDDPNATDVITSESEITILWSTTVSIYCFGGLIGGSVAGLVADKIGRYDRIIYIVQSRIGPPLDQVITIITIISYYLV